MHATLIRALMLTALCLLLTLASVVVTPDAQARRGDDPELPRVAILPLDVDGGDLDDGVRLAREVRGADVYAELFEVLSESKTLRAIRRLDPMQIGVDDEVTLEYAEEAELNYIIVGSKESRRRGGVVELELLFCDYEAEEPSVTEMSSVRNRYERGETPNAAAEEAAGELMEKWREDRPPMVTSITWEPERVYAGMEVTFSATASGAGNIETWIWEFSDGYSSVDEAPVHVFAEAGDYEVTLTVRSGRRGRSGAHSLTREVEVRPPAIELAVTPTPNIGPAPLEVAFAVEVLDGDVDELVWKLGDGATARGDTVTHTYERMGVYAATVIARGPKGTLVYDVPQVVVALGAGAPEVKDYGELPYALQFVVDIPDEQREHLGPAIGAKLAAEARARRIASALAAFGATPVVADVDDDEPYLNVEFRLTIPGDTLVTMFAAILSCDSTGTLAISRVEDEVATALETITLAQLQSVKSLDEAMDPILDNLEYRIATAALKHWP